jgi:hypothetical protein
MTLEQARALIETETLKPEFQRQMRYLRVPDVLIALPGVDVLVGLTWLTGMSLAERERVLPSFIDASAQSVIEHLGHAAAGESHA